ncbi:aldehyde dehydrogenase family protein [Salinactinospora qingdaonensis]|uniref:Aldehyde dehydrogenase family protein n=1 Tax=Salinactinospora qingdaonensis TaxID=702744 RepID=A0ABP7ESV1_9ACTN
MSDTLTLTQIQPIICGETAPSRDRVQLDGVDGQPLADIGTAPRLLAQAAVTKMRSALDPSVPSAEIFATAGQLFATAEVGGESPQEYRQRVSAATGAPIGVIDRASAGIATELGQTDLLNSSELPAPFAVPGFETRWVPRGALLAAIVPNNHPEPNVSWVRSLSLGYSVAVKPGSRDPFTPRRLIRSLLDAGLPPEKVSLLPGGHEIGEHLLAQADLSLFYGGPDAVKRWRTNNEILVRGPGHSKALIDVPVTEELIGDLASWVAGDGGVRCNNISAVLTSQDHRELADRLAERLAALPTTAATDPTAVLPAIRTEDAEAMRAYLATLSEGAVDHSSPRYPDGVVSQTASGTTVLRPLVLSTDDPTDQRLGTELPFPFVMVAPWREEHGSAPLGGSLVVNVLTSRDDLVERLVREPSVRKVVSGQLLPWASRPELPHDGSLAGFLMEPKAVVSEVSA